MRRLRLWLMAALLASGIAVLLGSSAADALTGVPLAAAGAAAKPDEAGGQAAVLPDYPVVTAGRVLDFPRDAGAHPAYRTEWWYITGWLRLPDGAMQGFQMTFFRTRPPLDIRNPSRFAPDQVLFAHAALADPRVGHLLHDQRDARAGFGLADAATESTRVHLGDWRLERQADGQLRGRVIAQDFALDLVFKPQQARLLEGDEGYSRKGPDPRQASYYVSLPQLAVSGTVTRNGQATAVQGTAWLDHEWSSEVLATGAVGWDWTGINFEDGGALMAFRIRTASGATVWAGGTWRHADGRVSRLDPQDVQFVPLRWWRSPRTQVRYPVVMRLRAADQWFTLEPLMDDQELDARATTQTIYWEGAVRVMRDGQALGHAYLELTGYRDALNF